MFSRVGSYANFLFAKSNSTLRFFSVSSFLSRDRSVLYNTSHRPDPVYDEAFRNKVSEGHRHPRTNPIIEPSEEFTRNVNKIFDKSLASQREQIHKFVTAGDKFDKFIKHRHVPLEKSESSARKKRIGEMLKEEFNLKHLDTEDNPDRAVMKKMKSLENSHLCKWTPIEFDETGSLTYLLSRTAAEFASLTQVFSQIREKDPAFQPRTLFDFGSGVGSGLWAARDIFGKVTEAFLVDPSKHMNDLARLILGGGDGLKIPAGISFRLHTPVS